MLCPYYGVPCSCEGTCKLDIRRRDPISGRLIVVKLGDFHCVCGAQIETPVTPCDTPGCKHKGRLSPPFKKETQVNKKTKVITMEWPDKSFSTVVQGGKLCGETWLADKLSEAISNHDSLVMLVKEIR